MAKRVQLVLRKDINKLGRTGDLVEVAPGYARNYLLPQGLAVHTTPPRSRTAALAGTEARGRGPESRSRKGGETVHLQADGREGVDFWYGHQPGCGRCNSVGYGIRDRSPWHHGARNPQARHLQSRTQTAPRGDGNRRYSGRTAQLRLNTRERSQTWFNLAASRMTNDYGEISHGLD
jgi:hypothetical protein